METRTLGLGGGKMRRVWLCAYLIAIAVPVAYGQVPSTPTPEKPGGARQQANIGTRLPAPKNVGVAMSDLQYLLTQDYAGIESLCVIGHRPALLDVRTIAGVMAGANWTEKLFAAMAQQRPEVDSLVLTTDSDDRRFGIGSIQLMLLGHERYIVILPYIWSEGSRPPNDGTVIEICESGEMLRTLNSNYRDTEWIGERRLFIGRVKTKQGAITWVAAKHNPPLTLDLKPSQAMFIPYLGNRDWQFAWQVNSSILLCNAETEMLTEQSTRKKGNG